MAALILPSRRVVQPQGPAGIDGGSSLCRALGFHVSDFSGWDAIGHRSVTRTASLAYGATALGRGFSSAANAAFSAPLNLSSTNAITVAFILRQTVGTGLQVLVEHTANQNSNDGSFLAYIEAGNLDISVANGTGGSGAYNAIRCAAPAAGRTTRIVLTFERISSAAKAIRVWYEGIEQSTTQTFNGIIGGSFANSTTYFFGRSASSLFFNGAMHDVSLWRRKIADSEVSAWAECPCQLYRPTQRRIIVDMGAGGGAVDLAPAGATHAQAADNVVLSTATSLTVNSAEHAQTAENVALTTATALTAADASHAQSADNLTLGTTVAVDLAVADASHAHAADSLALVAASVLTVADAAHAHTADSVGLTTVETLTVASADHAHSAENVSLTIGGIGLAVSDATHAQAADAPTLSADSFLVTADATHGHTADLLTLSTATFFVVDDAVHAQTADSLTLDGAPTLQVAGADHQHTADAVALTMESWLEAASAAHAHTAQNITLSVFAEAEPLTNAEMRELLESVRVLRIQLEAVNGYTSLIPALL